jgi:hypothetical protein
MTPDDDGDARAGMRWLYGLWVLGLALKWAALAAVGAGAAWLALEITR